MKIKLLAKYSKESNRGYAPVPGFPDYKYSRSTSAKGYDWLVVYDEMPVRSTGTLKWGKETLDCPREQTMLVTQEPMCVKNYGRTFTHQFGHYLTTRRPEDECHPNYHLGRGYYWSYYGKKNRDVKDIDLSCKTKIISAVCSAKRMKHTCHNARYELISHLAENIPGFDWFGKGVKPLNFKYEALDTYKYHIAVENCISKGHCTEKLLDSILGECLTFYAGDPDVGTWLPPDSFVPIPLDDHIEAEKIIKAAISEGLFEKRIEAVREAKRLILTKYNFWAQVIKVIEEVQTQNIAVQRDLNCNYIVSRARMRLKPLTAVKDGFLHLCRIVKNV